MLFKKILTHSGIKLIIMIVSPIKTLHTCVNFCYQINHSNGTVCIYMLAAIAQVTITVCTHTVTQDTRQPLDNVHQSVT